MVIQAALPHQQPEQRMFGAAGSNQSQIMICPPCFTTADSARDWFALSFYSRCKARAGIPAKMSAPAGGIEKRRIIDQALEHRIIARAEGAFDADRGRPGFLGGDGRSRPVFGKERDEQRCEKQVSDGRRANELVCHGPPKVLPGELYPPDAHGDNAWGPGWGVTPMG